MPHPMNRSPCPPLLDSAPTEPAKPIRDAVVSFEVQPLTDAQAGPRRIAGVAKEADKINLNRYYFSLECCTDMVNAAQVPMEQGELIGLNGHPDFWVDGRKGRIDDVAIRFDRLWMDGKLMKFEGTLVGTARGRDLMAVLDSGVRVGMSTNINGMLEYQQARDVDETWPDPEEWIGVVQVGARLTTIDAVMTPSDSAGDVQAADSHNPNHREEPTVKNLQELKEKFPDLYAQAVADGKKEAGTTSLEDQLAAERTARLKLEREIQDGKRAAIATKALTDASLPKLGKSGDIDLDARFEKRVTDAALRAESDEEAATEVAAMIAERKLNTAQVTDTTAPNTPGIPRKDQVQDAQKGGRNLVSSVRAGLGLT
ncbi:hypothetical protein GCM10017784_30320 [Deinococcus indicus]|uniref:hypothetical protein n=1 Tax=Deinococcus indicus TaxID=223556 RepID=UPI00174B99C1|nr:hypothetical protein [Deinococcus indicus]GHG34454.1 hypothetical protein GCM10017784_30320 [Deinococcus indicus]